jgi:quaternary ammonium compound-resistance protein SugE
MHWLYLVIASGLEVCWMYSLKYLDFAKIRQAPWHEALQSTAPWITALPLVGYIVFGVANVVCFSMATKGIPMALAFGVWMGLALVGAKVVDTLFFQEVLSWKELLFMGFILIGVVGLKSSS